MIRYISAVTIVMVVIPTLARADTPGPRILTRHGVTSPSATTHHRLGRDPVLRNFLSFDTFDGSLTKKSGDGRLSSKSESATHPRLLPYVVVIERPVVVPDAVVSRGLANQPVHPHLIEVFLLGEGQKGSSTIFLDPNEDYEHQGSLVLDQDHSINRAQRMARKLRARGPMVIRGLGNRANQRTTTPSVRPNFIIEKPGGVIRPKVRPKKANELLMVRSDD